MFLRAYNYNYKLVANVFKVQDTKMKSLYLDMNVVLSKKHEQHYWAITAVSTCRASRLTAVALFCGWNYCFTISKGAYTPSRPESGKILISISNKMLILAGQLFVNGTLKFKFKSTLKKSRLMIRVAPVISPGKNARKFAAVLISWTPS